MEAIRAYRGSSLPQKGRLPVSNRIQENFLSANLKSTDSIKAPSPIHLWAQKLSFVLESELDAFKEDFRWRVLIHYLSQGLWGQKGFHTPLSKQFKVPVLLQGRVHQAKWDTHSMKAFGLPQDTLLASRQ